MSLQLHTDKGISTYKFSRLPSSAKAPFEMEEMKLLRRNLKLNRAFITLQLWLSLLRARIPFLVNHSITEHFNKFLRLTVDMTV